jgi:hypothetical protein
MGPSGTRADRHLEPETRPFCLGRGGGIMHAVALVLTAYLAALKN